MIDLKLLKEEAERIGVELDETALNNFDMLAQMLVDWNGRIKLEEVFSPFSVSFFTATIKGMEDTLAITQPGLMDIGYLTAFPYIAATVNL